MRRLGLRIGLWPRPQHGRLVAAAVRCVGNGWGCALRPRLRRRENEGMSRVGPSSGSPLSAMSAVCHVAGTTNAVEGRAAAQGGVGVDVGVEEGVAVGWVSVWTWVSASRSARTWAWMTAWVTAWVRVGEVVSVVGLGEVGLVGGGGGLRRCSRLRGGRRWLGR